MAKKKDHLPWENWIMFLKTAENIEGNVLLAKNLRSEASILKAKISEVEGLRDGGPEAYPEVERLERWLNEDLSLFYDRYLVVLKIEQQRLGQQGGASNDSQKTPTMDANFKLEGVETVTQKSNAAIIRNVLEVKKVETYKSDNTNAKAKPIRTPEILGENDILNTGAKKKKAAKKDDQNEVRHLREKLAKSEEKESTIQALEQTERQLKTKVKDLETEIKNNETKVNELEAELKKPQAKVKDLETEIEKQANKIRQMEEDKAILYMMDFINNSRREIYKRIHPRLPINKHETTNLQKIRDDLNSHLYRTDRAKEEAKKRYEKMIAAVNWTEELEKDFKTLNDTKRVPIAHPDRKSGTEHKTIADVLSAVKNVKAVTPNIRRFIYKVEPMKL